MNRDIATAEDAASSAPSLPGEELLSNLMSALAAGARAVQGIPVEEDFEYHSSFPEFQNLLQQNQDDLLDAILLALTSADENVPVDSEFHGLSDPLLWEACSDICEWLTEQAEASGTSTLPREQFAAATDKAKSSFGQLMKGIVKMDKPQDVYNIFGGSAWNPNSRAEPFVPPITEKFHATKPLDLSLRSGHGIENRFGALRAAKTLPQDIVAPSHHVAHPYQDEIANFEFTGWKLEEPAKIAVANGPLEAVWVDTPETLEKLTKNLESAREIAVDLEAHNYRSFGGMTCLIQITVGATDTQHEPRNYLVDPFPLWQKLGKALGPAFADPRIVKVMHGAESDVQWLQRDFGIYVVNLFDTYYAAKILELSKLGYAHLLTTYVGIVPDKSHQLADWRQRPLPPAMKEYAIMDTHYLLRIYQHLKHDLEHKKTASISMVVDKSREVSLIRYVPEPFKPNGYKALMSKRGYKSELTETQEQVLKELYDWRDQMARQYDESLIFVCENKILLRLAFACPMTLSALQGLLQPLPPLLMRHAKQVLGIVQRSVKLPFFKPDTKTVAEDEVVDAKKMPTRTLLSPVLGTEALYRQAGWISPYNEDRQDGDNDVASDPINATTDEDDADHGVLSTSKPRRVLAVHETNQQYHASQFTSHSLQLAHHRNDGTGVVDGRGPARVIHAIKLDEEVELARTTAASIRTAQQKYAMYGLISGQCAFEDGDADDEAGEDDNTFEQTTEEQFVIPRSMREIYRISNHNRRNKKPSSPLTLKPKESEVEELAKAEEILKARAAVGKKYFDEIPGTPKRQRTRSTASASSEEKGQDSMASAREDDIVMMEEVGWITGKEEAAAMMKQRDSAGEEDGDGAGISSEDDGGKQPKAMYDYSTVGAIGAFCATPSANPFFSGAATSGGYLNQQSGKPDNKKKQATNKGKQSRRQQPTERPERTRGRSQAYKKR